MGLAILLCLALAVPAGARAPVEGEELQEDGRHGQHLDQGKTGSEAGLGRGNRVAE